MELGLDLLRDVAGFGVAGNFAGHLEQAGEDADFAAVDAAPEAPKGIFPWYVPGDGGFLGTFPLSHDRIVKPPAADDDGVNLQLEPEVGVLLDLVREDDGTVGGLVPVAIAAFNDCSIRRPGAKKISHKKNWGPASKGVARTAIPVDDLEPTGPTAGFRLASFLRRGGEVHAYGVDSPLPGYSYYGATLLGWIADRLAQQRGDDGTPLEDVGALVRTERALVGIGATRYTPYGETTFLDVGDQTVVVVYDAASTSPAQVEECVRAGDEDTLRRASVLRQDVVAPADS